LRVLKHGSPPKNVLVAGMEHEDWPTQAAVTADTELLESQEPLVKEGQVP